MKVYIAGKISGDPDYREKFLTVELQIRQALRAAQRGALFDFDVNFDAKPVVLNPARQPERMSPADYMRLSFAMIDCADEVLFLPDWEDSPGAQLEMQYCTYIGKPISVLPAGWREGSIA